MKLRSYKKRLGVLAVTWVATAALVSVFYVAVLAPAWARRDQVGQALVEARRNLDWAIEATRPERLAQLKEESSALESRADDFIYTPDGLSQLALSIGRLATERKAANVSVQIRDAAASKDKRIVERRLEVECNTGFHEFVGLLNTFERYEPALLIDAFSLQRSGGATSEKLNTKMTVTVLVDTQAQVQSPPSR